MPADDKKVSIITIAQLANVSIATVSRILNKTGRYSAETEKKVLQLVEEYGYTPNVTAQSLRTNRTQSIGVIVPDITNEFFAKIVRSIENSILPYGYSVFICDTHEDEQMENRHIHNLIAKNVDGVIYISGKADAAGNEVANGTPVVYIDRHPENAPTIICSDNERGGFLAAEELLRCGCRRIVIMQDYHRLSTQRQRYAGYANAHRAIGIEPLPALCLPDSPGYGGANRAVTDLLARGVSFDGIFATNDWMALGALHALKDGGILVPEQVKLVGFDNISISEFCETPITTISQDTDAMGRLSVASLVAQIHKEVIERQAVVVPVALCRRKTT